MFLDLFPYVFGEGQIVCQLARLPRSCSYKDHKKWNIKENAAYILPDRMTDRMAHRMPDRMPESMQKNARIGAR